MILDLLHTDTYRSIMRRHLYEVVAYLLENDQDFAVAADVDAMRFDPPLPRSITQHFDEVALFVLVGYTFQSAWLDEEHLYFEAGFGKEDIAAEVTLPLLAIRQIFVGEYPVAINVASPAPFRSPEYRPARRSMEALLRNPENRRFLDATQNPDETQP